MQHLGACHCLEELTGHMNGRANAGRSHVHLAGIGLAVIDELRHRFRGEFRIDLHDVRRSRDAGDRRDILNEMKAEILVKTRVDPVCRVDEEQRVPVGLGIHG